MKMTTETFINNMKAAEHQNTVRKEEFDKAVYEEDRWVIR